MLHPTSLLPAEYLPMLDDINNIVISSGVPLEGNLFYHHHEPNPGRDNIVSYFQTKRHNFALVCKETKCMLEIGVNAGHSALLALANGVEFHGVDICWHAYTHRVADYLKSKFRDRFHFYAGDSRMTVPKLAEDKPWLRFDLLHIDGHHGLEYCEADTRNASAMALKNAWIIIDDTDMPHLEQFYQQELVDGNIIAALPEGWIENPHHRIGKVA